VAVGPCGLLLSRIFPIKLLNGGGFGSVSVSSPPVCSPARRQCVRCLQPHTPAGAPPLLHEAARAIARRVSRSFETPKISRAT
jgi:hypothetical protein